MNGGKSLCLLLAFDGKKHVARILAASNGVNDGGACHYLGKRFFREIAESLEGEFIVATGQVAFVCKFVAGIESAERSLVKSYQDFSIVDGADLSGPADFPESDNDRVTDDFTCFKNLGQRVMDDGILVDSHVHGCVSHRLEHVC